LRATPIEFAPIFRGGQKSGFADVEGGQEPNGSTDEEEQPSVAVFVRDAHAGSHAFRGENKQRDPARGAL